MVKRVCLVSSGTGGHLLPAVVLARALEQRGHDAVLVTEGRRAEQVLLERFECRSATLPAGGGGVTAPMRLFVATRHARQFLRDEKVDLVVGTGGRTTVPVALAARSLGVPVALMEQNTVPGRANRWLAPLAGRVYLGLPSDSRPRRALVTGTPVRQGFGEIDRDAARQRLGLEIGCAVVLVTGGSQGARALNQLMPAALCALREPLQALHLSGDEDDDVVRMRYAAGADHGLMALVRGYAFDMPTFYAAADLVICRGGGGTISELAAAKRPAIIVPYPHHRDRQQYHNGKLLERVGAAVVVEESGLSVASMTALVASLLHSGRLEEMGCRAATLRHEDSCARILEDLGEWAELA